MKLRIYLKYISFLFVLFKKFLKYFIIWRLSFIYPGRDMRKELFMALCSMWLSLGPATWSWQRDLSEYCTEALEVMGDVCVLSNETQHSDLWGMTSLLSHMPMMQRCSPSVLQSPPPSHYAKELLAMTGGQRVHWSEAWTKKVGGQ